MLRKLVSDKPDKKELSHKDVKNDSSKKNDSMKTVAPPKEKEKEKALVKDKGKKSSTGVVAVDDQIALLERGAYDSGTKIISYFYLFFIFVSHFY